MQGNRAQVQTLHLNQPSPGFTVLLTKTPMNILEIKLKLHELY